MGPPDQQGVWLIGSRVPRWLRREWNVEDFREDLKRRFGPTDDPVVKARRLDLVLWLLPYYPEVQQELIEQGRVIGARRSLTAMLARRGLVISPAQELQVASCTDLALLRRWHDQAITAASADDAFA